MVVNYGGNADGVDDCVLVSRDFVVEGGVVQGHGCLDLEIYTVLLDA